MTWGAVAVLLSALGAALGVLMPVLLWRDLRRKRMAGRRREPGES